jgi:hypothetical protein
MLSLYPDMHQCFNCITARPFTFFSDIFSIYCRSIIERYRNWISLDPRYFKIPQRCSLLCMSPAALPTSNKPNQPFLIKGLQTFFAQLVCLFPLLTQGSGIQGERV